LATELLRSSSPNGPPHPNTKSVTNLPDEYNSFLESGMYVKLARLNPYQGERL
jgi:hypothetical protein